MDSEVIDNVKPTVLNNGVILNNSLNSVDFCGNQTCVSLISSCSQNIYKEVCTETMHVDPSIYCNRISADQYVHSHTVYNVDSMFIPKRAINSQNLW